jgi:hypothetical protein
MFISMCSPAMSKKRRSALVYSLPATATLTFYLKDSTLGFVFDPEAADIRSDNSMIPPNRLLENVRRLA